MGIEGRKQEQELEREREWEVKKEEEWSKSKVQKRKAPSYWRCEWFSDDGSFQLVILNERAPFTFGKFISLFLCQGFLYLLKTWLIKLMDMWVKSVIISGFLCLCGFTCVHNIGLVFVWARFYPSTTCSCWCWQRASIPGTVWETTLPFWSLFNYYLNTNRAMGHQSIHIKNLTL